MSPPSMCTLLCMRKPLETNSTQALRASLLGLQNCLPIRFQVTSSETQEPWDMVQPSKVKPPARGFPSLTPPAHPQPQACTWWSSSSLGSFSHKASSGGPVGREWPLQGGCTFPALLRTALVPRWEAEDWSYFHGFYRAYNICSPRRCI